MEYRTERQGTCPKCRSYLLTYDAIKLEGESVYYPFRCDSCGAEGKEWHDLVYISNEVQED